MAEKNAFLIRLLVTVIILASFVFMFVRDLDTEGKKKIKAGCYYQEVQCVRAPCEPMLVCPTQEPAFEVSMCPESGWVDCMPIVDESRQVYCSQEFLTWAKTSCPNFQGAAL